MPIFFDTSALVKRYDVAEEGAARVRDMCQVGALQGLLISRVTRLEIASALNRKVRERRFGTTQRDQAWRLFNGHCGTEYRVIAPPRLQSSAQSRLFR